MKNPDPPATPALGQTNAAEAASSRERIFRSLSNNRHILLDENPEDFLLLLNDLFDRFQSVGDVEDDLVLHIAENQWRLRRTFPMEAGLYRLDMAETRDRIIREGSASKTEDIANRAPAPCHPRPPIPANTRTNTAARPAMAMAMLPPASVVKLASYRSGIERSINWCIRTLKVYQAARLRPRK